MQKITIHLWFTNEAEEAANFYTSLFPHSKITMTSRYPEEGQEITKREPGSVMVVGFELDGQSFMALNGGDAGFHFNESISLLISCDTQEEIDHYWDGLTADGGAPGQCGWLKDKYGVSWQVAPPILDQLLNDPDKEKANRVMAAMLKMNKIDIAELQIAAEG